MTLSPVDQIGFVVRDVDQAVEYYSTVFGWGPFDIREVEMKGFEYRGRKADARMKIAFTRSGPIEIELIQVLEGETPHTEFLREHGEGLHHLRFPVDDMDKTLAKLARDAIHPVMYYSVPQAGMKFVYIDSDKVGGVMFEFAQMKSPSP